MINPITEMRADITTTKVLQAELQQTLKQKRQAVHGFYTAKTKAENELPAERNVQIEPPKTPKYSPMADKSKEAELLKMAKARYQSYHDIAVFAKELGLRPGVVYLTLKHHNFIKPTESTQYRVLESYYRHNGNLRSITEETGLTVWICAKTIEQLGLSPKWQSYRASLSTTASGIGNSGEEEFIRLVPQAVDMNQDYLMNNPTFDFIINEKTIDVKTGTLRINNSTSKDGNYAFRVNNERPDFYCFFCVKDSEKGVISGNYHILLIPSVIIPSDKTTVFISHDKHANKNSALYWDFEVEPAALESVLESITQEN